jgi:hypothetical protein
LQAVVELAVAADLAVGLLVDLLERLLQEGDVACVSRLADLNVMSNIVCERDSPTLSTQRMSLTACISTAAAALIFSCRSFRLRSSSMALARAWATASADGSSFLAFHTQFCLKCV